MAKSGTNQLSGDQEIEMTRRSLLDAAKNGAIKIIQSSESTIKRFPLIYGKKRDNWTTLAQELLRQAALFNQPQIVELLITKFETNPNEPHPGNRKTPFHLAAWAGLKELAQVMIKYEADPFAKDEYGGDVFQASAYFGTVAFAETLLNEYSPELSINYQDKKGDTALMLAVRKNKPEMVEFLLSENADASIRNKNGYTALHQAIMLNHEYIIKILINHFAGQTDKNYLKERLADVTKRSGKHDDSWTALHLASFNGNRDLVIDIIKVHNLDADVDSAKEAYEKRKLTSLRKFRQTIGDEIVSVFREFRPVVGKIGGRPMGAIPEENQKEEKSRRRLLMNSIIYVNAVFEDYLHKILDEAYSRAVNDDKKIRKEWVINLFKEELNKGIQFTVPELQFVYGNSLAQIDPNNSESSSNGETMSKKEKKKKQGKEDETKVTKEKCDAKLRLMEAALAWRTATSPNIADIPIAVAPILEERKTNCVRHLSNPVLETFCKCFNKLFYCEDLEKNEFYTLEKSINALGYKRFPIGVSTPDMDDVQITLSQGEASSQDDSCAYKTLSSFSRLFYGMRCLWAHGNPEPTLQQTLNRVDRFETNQFDMRAEREAEKIGEIVEYYNTMTLRIKEYATNHNGTAYDIHYNDYVTCVRIYGFIAWVLHWAILKSLGVWEEIPIGEEDHKDDYCLPTS